MSTSRPAKHTQRALAVVERARLQQVSDQPSRLAKLIEQAGKPTRVQRQIAVETVTRAGSIDATSMLHEWGSRYIHRSHVVSQQHVYETVSRLNAMMTTPMDEVTARDMAAWTTAQKEMLIRHEATLLDRTVTNITVLATDPLPQEEEKPKGILGWLLG